MRLRTYSATYVQGYRYRDISRALPRQSCIKKHSKIICRAVMQPRRMMARSLGWHVSGIAPLIPDIRDVETGVEGAKKRFMRECPKIDNRLLRRFRSFVRVWIRRNLVPLAHDTDVSFESWIEQADYPAWRKKEIADSRVNDLSSVHFRNNSFIKREYYPVPKHARWINSRSDSFKAFSGPLFHRIEQALYEKKMFVKHVPVEERMDYIHSILDSVGQSFVATDHTAFEAHFVSKVMRVCEMQLYSYMLRNLPDGAKYVDVLDRALCSMQRCRNHGIVMEVESRMSGDMCTSLGNSFTNWMVMAFVTHECGWKELRGVVEGDDGLFIVNGPVPAPSMFSKLGFEVVMELHNNINEAGFCHLFSSPCDTENLVDPVAIMCRSGWTHSKWLHAGEGKMLMLSKSKAFSTLCECPANPITSSMCLWILRCTSHVESAPLDIESNRWWLRRVMMSNLEKNIARAKLGPTMAQRQFVSDKWGISIFDQFEVEKYFDGLDKIQVIDHPTVVDICSRCRPWWRWAYDNLVVTMPKGSQW